MADNGAKAMEHALTAGSDVWLNDAGEGWLKARVKKIDGTKATVLTENGDEKEADIEALPLQNSDGRSGVEDMTQLNHLHEPGVLWNLKKRYTYDDIYTYTGNILIAVNPFQNLGHLYGTHMMDMYKGQDLGGLSPHVYATAEAAYRQMVSAGRSQSVLVSGESGAGKTETCKLIMKYLAFLGGYAKSGSLANASAGVESKVLESNPLLEAFGNAKTVRNSNSSRFGKFTEIQFDKQWRIVGAAIRTYLLERSRVVAVNDPERNYHIFYQLCAGASAEERERLHLVDPSQFYYLSRSSCVDIPGTDNAAEYAVTRRAMAVVGIPPVDQEAIFAVVASVLHLGNCKFIEDPKTDGGCMIADAESEQHLSWAAELLKVPAEGLLKALSTRTRQTPDGPIVSPISVSAAMSNRDSLAKTIYSRLFDWLVQQVNYSIGHVKDPTAVVGVLDIYGFEQFKVNDFEQLCINLANEKLQQHFNQHVFKMEQAEYEAEEIDWTTIEFVDNQDVLDLIEKKPLGVLDSLDEACRFPTATGATFAEKLYNNKDVMSHKRFQKPKRSNTAFIIDHYAGQVEYQVDNFLDKNKDFVVKEHQDLLAGSSLPLVARALFKPEEDKPEPPPDRPSRARASNASYKFVSVGTQFKKQLSALMASLSTMEPHYVRCIKPNNVMLPSEFDNKLVLQQLRCGGVLEAVRISCAGYPSRRQFFDFVEHFWHLAPEKVRSGDPDVDITMGIIKQYLESGYAKGKTKIFLKGGQMAVLEKHRTNLLNKSAITIQKYVRGHLQGGQYRKLRKTALLLQSVARMTIAKRLVHRMRCQKSALKIQTAWRGSCARADYKKARNAVIAIQSAWRGKTARKQASEMRAENAATCIQRWYRGHVVRKEYKAAVRKVILVQCAWRSKVARKELRARRADARNTGKLMEDKANLEKQLKDMQVIVAKMQEGRREDRDKMKAAQEELAKAKSELETLRTQAAAVPVAKVAAMEAAAKAVEAENQRIQAELEEKTTELAELKTQVEDLQRELVDIKEDGTAGEQRHKEEVNRLRAERERTKKEHAAQTDELLQRLQNACAQRDEAREQVLGLEAALEAQRIDTEEKVAQASKAAQVAAEKSYAQRIPQMQAGPGTPGSHTSPVQLREGMNKIAATIQMFNSSGTRTSPQPQTPVSVSNQTLGALSTSPSSAVTPGSVVPLAQTPTATSAYESELDRRQQEMQAKQQQLAMQQRSENQDALVKAIERPLGFHKSRPLAAMVIFRSCIQWHAFEADRTNLFERIITTIGEQIEQGGGGELDNNDNLCYWLSNTVTLLLLLQKNIKPAATASSRRAISNAPQSGFLAGARSTFSSFLGGSTRRASLVNSGDASIHGGGHGGFKQIAAKYPALLFKQQLDACMGKIFPLLRDNVKRAVQTPLSQCIHAPRTSHMSRSGRMPQHGDDSPWKTLLKVLQTLHEQLEDNEVPKFLRRKLFLQLFSFINVQLFNQLLLRRECCSFANGEYVKQGLGQVEEWVLSAGVETVGQSWEELRFIRQAVEFLVLGAKQKKQLADIQHNLCSELSVQQLYRISTMYWDDKYGTETVSGEVLQQMRAIMQSQQGSASHSFLLDDDSSNPFNANEVQISMNDKELYSEMPIPDPLKDNKAFEFLARDLKLSAAASQQPAQ